MYRVAIIGYSGHAFVVLDACKKMGIPVHFYCDRSKTKHNNPYQLTFLGDEGSESFDWNGVDKFVLGIGDNNIRRRVAERIIEAGKEVVTVIHPTAVINDFVRIGKGSFLSSNCVVNSLASVGQNCIINTGAIIEHECILGDSVHIAPGAVLTGSVTVGAGTFIGANAVIKQGITIGENVVVGAGSVVIKDIGDNETWVGNPVRKIKQ
ncbi:Maltose O-acetyltransferase [Sphingobacterium spiritivorum]|uniref:Maltose O-acetyltransferase n=1 Tax=Sphingobacterium spiritivorum TaxID=258 RepID=A0A380C7D4_SPHSI|nr:acetyltransferase [Sphingobacterium spiritivorum]SUJ13195.1 Maltose O-acetyltransferase [Sphingobacterium spiritivorum]